jgi:hypothetical protein
LRRFLAECYVDFAPSDCICREDHFDPEFMKNVVMGVMSRRDLPKHRSRTTNPREFIDMKEPETPTMKFPRYVIVEPTNNTQLTLLLVLIRRVSSVAGLLYRRRGSSSVRIRDH